jgi:hypothetical protein
VERGGTASGFEEPSGWIVFAGVMLLLVGFFSIIDGLVALFNSNRYGNFGGGRTAFIDNFTTWGWIHLLLGIFIVLVGFALMAERTWARWAAIVLILLNALAQISFVGVTPFWSLIVIAIDIIILWQLTANWRPAEP